MRLILVRHGESEGNAGRILQGRADFGLTPLGRRQAAWTAEALREVGPTRLLTSPLRRAADTAGAVAEALGLAAAADEALLEYDVGVISGLTGAEVQERYPEVWAAIRSGGRPRIEGEEGRDRFFARVTGFLRSLAEDAGPDTVVAVTHGGVVNAACYVALGIEYNDFFRRSAAFAVGNCSITEIRAEPGGPFVLVRANDGCHLRPPTHD